MTATRAHGKNAVFKVDDSGGTLRDISGDVNDVTGLPGARQLSETTAFGDGGQKNIPGLVVVQFTVTGMYNTTASTGSITVLKGLRTTSVTSSFEYGPEGGTSGLLKWLGEAWMQDFVVAAQVGDKIPFTATFQVDGLVTESTF